MACAQWLQGLVTNGSRVIVPEIADYEVRRELLRANQARGIERLDALIVRLEYLPISTAAMRHAATLWAWARQQGLPTATDQSLDADVILAAQAVTLGIPEVVIATTNVGHLSRFTSADLWQNVRSS
jgi:hypothetical protein